MHTPNLKQSATKLVVALTTFCALFCSNSLSAEVWGKVDAAPTYVHIDVLESGNTVKRMDMLAFKGDATIVVWKGLCFKPTLLVGTGEGKILSTGLGIGHCTPICDWLVLTPSAGCLYTNVETHIGLDIPYPLSPTGFFHLHRVKERFWSISPYVGLDATFIINCDWRIYAQFQYSWSRTHTTLSKHEGALNFKHTDKSHAEGPSYGVMIEHDLNDDWSINMGGAYNISLTHEKHGLRGAGCKLGLAYWF